MKKLVFLIIIPIIGIALSCKKDDLTTPTRVDFSFSMLPYRLIGSNNPSLSIDKCTIQITSVEFDGKRGPGTDYYFTSEFSTPLIVDMNTGAVNQNVSYDIPQGIYNKVELDFLIEGNDKEHALLVEGSYGWEYEKILIRFEYSSQELIRVNAKNNQGDAQIVISSGSDVEAEVIFDAALLFELVSVNLFYEADLIQNPDEVILLINSENNIDIFNLLVARLNKSIRVIFDS